MTGHLGEMSEESEREFFERRVARLSSMNERARRILPLLGEVFDSGRED